MAGRRRGAKRKQVGDYRYEEAQRKNNPPAGIAPTYEARERRTIQYDYDPHLDPQLQWAGKAEHTSFEVDVVSLHIHERISTRAILEAVKKPEPQLSLFGETPLPADKQIEFYKHDVDWVNRLILGDSLLVMNSLLVKEGMAGKVQMIYIDPPYGIKYSSNFQPRIDRRDVKDKDEDLTHEPEQIKAYRDTWKLGIHSYLTYLRDRLLLARDLLTESGSIFVQINDENLHLVRSLLDEVFERENFVAAIPFIKRSPQPSAYLPTTVDYLLWFAKNKPLLKYSQLLVPKEPATAAYNQAINPDTEEIRRIRGPLDVPNDWRLFAASDLTSSHFYQSPAFEFRGQTFSPGNRYWSTSIEGLQRLTQADRLVVSGKRLRYKRFWDDFPHAFLGDIWQDVLPSSFGEDEKLYAVQTAIKAVERCILMTTDPGDLVLDPTCVRKGTRVWTPLSPPVNGGTSAPSPMSGRVGVGLIPIEAIQPGDLVLGHDGKPHQILRAIRKPYRGAMVGIQHHDSMQTLWVTPDHYILCQKRTQSYGAERTWRHVPKGHFERAQALRREMTPVERQLWNALRGKQLGIKFRKQHPIGPYIADFYSWEAGLVVELDGSSHFTPETQGYDHERDGFLSALGLTVLRFTNQEVTSQMEGILSKIVDAIEAVKPTEDHYKQWRRADSLQVGDVVYLGPEQQPVEITNLLHEETQEEVYDLEVEGVHSFLTEVCAVHNCGSGTTAHCAEKWGRRWITCDTSRVALAIARQRLMTAKYDYYELKDSERGPAGGFNYETVPHITLKSIAQNEEIDQIAAKYQPQIDGALAELNSALSQNWKEWEVPREAEEDWPMEAKDAHEQFWSLKRKKRREIDESIQRNAPQETLYDQPKVKQGIVRVSGPFTVEAIPVPAVGDPTQAPIPQFEEDEARARVSDRAGDYLTDMINLLQQQGGVLFPGGRKMELQNLRALNLGYLHAEGETQQNSKTARVALSFGPQHGPVTAFQVQEAIPTARMNGYDVLLFAGFSFDPEAQALIQKAPVAGLQMHFANIAPDVLVGDLLKTTRASQVFSVFGQPDVRVEKQKDDTYIAELRGVDIYDPLTGEVHSARGEDVAAWFLDTDYDGKTFHICQAFFPRDGKAWKKLQRALKAQIDPEAFEQMRSTKSFPFKPGEHKRIAVKVIDFRGNEVVKMATLAGIGSEQRRD